MKNWIITASASARRRPGTVKVAHAKQSDKDVRLVPFVFARDDAWILEFADNTGGSNGVIRFYTSGAQVQSGGSPLEVQTPYPEGELYGLQFAQSADVAYIAHANHALRKLVRNSATSWTLSTPTFNYTGPFLTENVQAILLDLESASGGALTTMEASDSLFDSVNDQHSLWLVAGGWTRIENVESATLAKVKNFGVPPTVDTETANWAGPYREGSIRSATITWGSSALANGDFGTFTASASIFSSSDVGIPFDIDANGSARTKYILVTEFVSATEVKGQVIFGGSFPGSGSGTDVRPLDDTNFPTDVATITPDGTSGTITLNSSKAIFDPSMIATVNEPGAYFELNDGIVEITSFTSSTQVSGVVRKTLSTQTATAVWKESAFSNYRGWPRVVALVNDRLILGGTAGAPATFYFSKAGDYENFTFGTNDGDSFEITLASDQIDKLSWVLNQRNLLVGTEGGEYMVAAQGPAPTPTDKHVRGQTGVGSKHLSPIQLRSAVLFVSQGESDVYEMVDSGNVSGFYESNWLNFFAQHLFDKATIKAWAYEQFPHSMIWVVLSDGSLRAFTYLPQYDVGGWTQHELAGNADSSGNPAKVRAIASIPNGAKHQTWVAVKRYVNGSTQTTIEHFDYDTYSDSAVAYSGPITNLTGLDHLEGEAVVARANGNDATLDSDTVSGGQVSLSEEASDTAEVGLQIVGDLIPMAPLFSDQKGPNHGRVVIRGVKLRITNTVALKLLDSRDTEFPLTLRRSTAAVGSLDPFTGYPPDGNEISLEGDLEDPAPTIRYDRPVDVEVNAIFVEVTNGP